VLVDDHRLLRLRPEIDGDVVVAVAEDARLDGEIAHALAETFLAANRAPLDDHTRRFTYAVEDADLGTERIHQRHSFYSMVSNNTHSSRRDIASSVRYRPH